MAAQPRPPRQSSIVNRQSPIVNRQSPLRDSIRAAIADALRTIGAPDDTGIVLDIPPGDQHGDLTTPVAFSLARSLGRSPAQLAREIVQALRFDPEEIAAADIAGAGFINIRCTPEFYHRRLDAVIRLGESYGRSDSGKGLRATIAVPVGRTDSALPLGEYRAAVLRDAVASLLLRTGHEPVRDDSPGPPGSALRVEYFDAADNGMVPVRSRTLHLPVRNVVLLDDGLPATGDGVHSPATAGLIAAFGESLVRFFLLMRPTGVPPTFDLALARLHSERNPYRNLQYALARIASLLRHAASESHPLNHDADLSPLRLPEERALIRGILLLPEAVARAAHSLEPSILAEFLRDLVSAFALFHQQCRIIPEPPPLRDARLRLLAATGTTLASGMGALGLSPDAAI